MNIKPEIALTIDCPECGKESVFLSSSLLDLDQTLTWACGHQHKNDHEFQSLAKFYTVEVVEATKKLAENKKNIEGSMNAKFPAKITINGERHG